jgi:glutaminyl-tRNA synthetase
LYDWFLDQLPPFNPRPRQIEFARLNLTYTVMSKRKLLALVNGANVNGWDDPRMPTIAAMRRRGYTPAAIRNFAERVGVAKRNSMHDISLLEFAVREDLNRITPRMMAVLDPVELIIENWDEAQVEYLTTENNPEDPAAGTREMPFSRVLYIERDDFMEDPPKKYFRLAPGRHVRLKSAYILECTGFEKDANGVLLRVKANYVPSSRSGQDTSGIKAKGTIHWVSAKHALNAEVRLYDRLFKVPEPDIVPEGGSFVDHLNADSLKIIEHAKVEPALASAHSGDRFQFLRLGYFCADNDSRGRALVFNRTVTLRDNWAKISGK